MSADSWRRANERRAEAAAAVARSLHPTPKPLSKGKNNRNNLRLDKCHYCGVETAGTLDHVVPKTMLPHSKHGGMANLVPSCRPCNAAKGSKRADCGCRHCMNAWEQYGPYGWEYLPVLVGIAMPSLSFRPYLGRHRCPIDRNTDGRVEGSPQEPVRIVPVPS